MKRTFYFELCYILGLSLLAVANAFMSWGDYGMGVVVAPAYLLHLKLSQIWPFFSFGMAEYLTQALVLLLMIFILRKFKVTFLFSFGTAVLYGLILDGAMKVTTFLPTEETVLALGLPEMGFAAVRLVVYLLADVVATFGIALLFKTYITQEAYDLIVKELALKYRWDLGKVKTTYDCISFVVAIVLSFAFFGFGHFEGIKIGSVVTTFVNGTLIGLWTKLLDKKFEFRDGLPLRKYFE